MSRSAMEGTRLARWVRMAIPLCKAAGRAGRRSGPGGPPTYADWQIAVLIFVAVLVRRKSKSAQYRYLFERRKVLTNWLGLQKFPGRSTYFDRYRHAYELFRAGVIEQGRRAIGEGLVDPEVTAVDKSLMPARGPSRHQWKRRKRKRLRGTDDEGPRALRAGSPHTQGADGHRGSYVKALGPIHDDATLLPDRYPRPTLDRRRQGSLV